MTAEPPRNKEENTYASEDADTSSMPSLHENEIAFLKSRKRLQTVWTIIGSLLLLAVFVYALGILSVPVSIIIWTAVFVFVLRSPVNWFEKKGINRVVGTALSFVIMAFVVAALGLLLFSPAFGIGDQFRNLVESVPGYLDALRDWYNNTYDEYAHLFQNDTIRTWFDQISGSLGTWVTETARMSAEGLVSFGGGVANAFVAIGFALVVAFWLLMDLPNLGKECMRLVGEKRKEDAQMLYLTFTQVMGGYIKATVLQCVFIGIMCAVAYTIIGIPNPAALGGIAGVLNIIPVVGPWLGGAMAALVGVFISPWIALLALVLTIIIQQFVYTFIGPKLMADSVNVHPAMVFIALCAGSALGGAMSGLMGSLLGMLASIPAVAAAKAIFVYYFEKRTGRAIVAEDGVFFKGAASKNPLAEISSLGKSAHENNSKLKSTSFWQRIFKHSDASHDEEKTVKPEPSNTAEKKSSSEEFKEQKDE